VVCRKRYDRDKPPNRCVSAHSTTLLASDSPTHATCPNLLTSGGGGQPGETRRKGPLAELLRNFDLDPADLLPALEALGVEETSV
jgi:hypothetical protein